MLNIRRVHSLILRYKNLSDCLAENVAQLKLVVHTPVIARVFSSKNAEHISTSSTMFRAAFARSLRLSALPRKQCTHVVPKLAIPQFAQASRTYAGFPALTRDIARERIIELLEGYDKVTSKDISEKSNFVTDLGLDSLDVVEVVMEVEHEFNIQIPDHEADSLKTVGQTVDYILSQPDAC